MLIVEFYGRLVIFYINSRGFIRAALEDKYHLVGEFLIDDVQGSVNFCVELLGTISKIEDDSLENWEGTGNVHTLIIKKHVASIVNEYTGESLNDFPIAVLKEAISKWREFVVSQAAK